MVKMKYLVVAASVILLAILAYVFLFQTEEKKVKKQFALLSHSVSKDPGETPFTLVQKMQRIGKLFSEKCEIKIPVETFSGSYTPEEITSLAARARIPFLELHLQFYDLTVDFPEKRIANVVLTGKLSGKLNNGETVDETRELGCVLRKAEKGWAFSTVEVVEVLKK